MRKQLIAAIVLAMPMGMANAGHPDTGCGAGTILWEGNLNAWWSKSLAVTTNGLFGNGTFGITSGTLGCSKDGALLAEARLTHFASANMDRLAADMSRGQGETLDVLAVLYEVADEDRSAFRAALQQDYGRIYSSIDITAEEMLVNIDQTLSDHGSLAQYALRG